MKIPGSKVRVFLFDAIPELAAPYLFQVQTLVKKQSEIQTKKSF
jgi:hypothetical protein